MARQERRRKVLGSYRLNVPLRKSEQPAVSLTSWNARPFC